jgi:hypothetical protein
MRTIKLIQCIELLSLCCVLSCASQQLDHDVKYRFAQNEHLWKPYSWSDSNQKMIVLEQDCGPLPQALIQKISALEPKKYDPEKIENFRCIPCYKGVILHRGMRYKISLQVFNAHNHENGFELLFPNQVAQELDTILSKCETPVVDGRIRVQK